MRKATYVVVFAVAMNVASWSGRASAEPMSKDCRAGYSTDRLAKRTIWCWADRFTHTVEEKRHVARTAVCISRWESGWEWQADNGTHAGLFQWSKAYWPSTRDQFPVVDRNTADPIKNGRTNAAFAVRWQAGRGYQPWAGNRCVS